jgi:hypothetical protein
MADDLRDVSDLSKLIPVNAPELHEPCIRARWDRVCEQYNSLVDLESAQANSQACRNLIEMTSLLIGKIYNLESVRGANPGHHRDDGGISEDGKIDIFHATVDFHNSIYMVLGNLANVVSKNRESFKNPSTGSVSKFLEWLASHDHHNFAVNNCIRPSKAFRTIVNHPQEHYTYNWETLTNGRSSIYVMLKGLGTPNRDKPTDSNVYLEGIGWHLPSPEECLTTIFLLDIVAWVLEGVEYALLAKGAFSNQDWYKQRQTAFDDYLRNDVDAVAFEFRRAVPSDFDDVLFAGVSVFD